MPFQKSTFKFLNFLKNDKLHSSAFELENLNINQFGLFLLPLFKGLKPNKTNNNYLIITKDNQESVKLFNLLKSYFQNLDFSLKINLFPSTEKSLYDDYYASETDLYKRWNLLQNLSINKELQPTILICDVLSSFEITAPLSYWKKASLELSISDIISPVELAERLSKMGYKNIPTLNHTNELSMEKGVFSKKGEIFDIYPINSSNGFRLFYFDDMIEKIAPIEPQTLKTIKDIELDSIQVFNTPLSLNQRQFTLNLRQNLPSFSDRSDSKFKRRENIFNELKNDLFFDNYPSYIPLFFKENNCLIDYFDNRNIFTANLNQISTILEKKLEILCQNFKQTASSLSPNILPHPNKYYQTAYTKKLKPILNLSNDRELINIDSLEKQNCFKFNFLNLYSLLNLKNTSLPTSHYEQLVFLLKQICNYFQSKGTIIFCHQHESAKDELLFQLKNFEEKNSIVDNKISERVIFKNYPIEESFFDQDSQILYLSEQELFKNKLQKRQARKKPKIDLFAEQIASLASGDFVIHAQHGTGKYLGLQQITFSGNTSDFLVLEYKNEDKVYVPVYKINLIQKQADAGAKLILSNLRNNKFLQLKERAKESAKKLAFDILRLNAKRKLKQGFSFSTPNHLYNQFELACPFELTEDQHIVMTDILDDMCSLKTMDRLVCGDVGFGKTELAMRAAYKAVLDNKQVVILVPTTILAFQHFENFQKRFQNFAVKIDFLSRFKKKKDRDKTIEDIKLGLVDIVIGTHQLLSKTIIFKDVGLIIIDEEHRFGVAHKEKLKIFREQIDFLTLTATPIPRTLQLSFLGIRDISIIKTAPPNRQSVQTSLIKNDDQTIKNAINLELKRGGQLYIVHNKVLDIELFASRIQDLAPNTSIVVAHGQMREKELEDKIRNFYNGKFQILIATTIIESGIDIPNANTMIIDKSENFGLSQLHQLRGRIGRSDRKAYAYFIVSDKKLNADAEKRLNAIKKYADLGAGLMLANSDLEIRGAGDILGAEQSGQITNIGLELYLELLQETIATLKGEKLVKKHDIEIKTPFNAIIPVTYIEDSKERLRIYKSLSNCKTEDQINDYQDYIEDLFGKVPEDFKVLCIIFKARTHLVSLPLKSVSIKGLDLVFEFIESELETNKQMLNNIIQHCLSHQKRSKLTPDYKLYLKAKKTITPDSLLEQAQNISKLLL